MTKAPLFITLEGIEGAGKTTALQFIEELLSQQTNLSYYLTREPGGTPIGELIRDLLLQKNGNEKMQVQTELLLLFASRAQHIQHSILPHLKRGDWVISDRFVDASYAYQGGGRGIPKKHINHLADWICSPLQPDLTILLDAPVSICLERLKQRALQQDRIESEAKDFFERVRKTYLELASACPKRFHIIDSSQSLENVKQQIGQLFQTLMA